MKKYGKLQCKVQEGVRPVATVVKRRPIKFKARSIYGEHLFTINNQHYGLQD